MLGFKTFEHWALSHTRHTHTPGCKLLINCWDVFFEKNIILFFLSIFLSYQPSCLKLLQSYNSETISSVSLLSDDKHPSIPVSVLHDVQFSLKSHQYQISTSSPYQIKCSWYFFNTTLVWHWKACLIVLRQRCIYYHAWPHILLNTVSALLSYPQNSLQLCIWLERLCLTSMSLHIKSWNYLSKSNSNISQRQLIVLE